ncbi:MAG TPA: sulfate ABC transporter substrate-binding protein [Gaiellaceae bacterium]|jgi:sulfate transport system substrate-binding protein
MKGISGLLVLASAVALLAWGCGGTTSASGGGTGGTITLVAYSTPKEAYEAVIPAFQKTSAGKGVKFEQSYGASGEQSRAVEAGLPASVVAFSLAPDVDRLVEADIVSADWNKDRYKGMVTDSVVVFVVRNGNPKGIHTWDDLVKPGIQVITPNPFTSGSARWNLMAAYGAQLELGRTPDQALAYLGDLLENTPVQDKSAREALQTFVGGKGDVMLAYENEAITAQQKGEDVDYVVPDQTILIENPVAVTKDAPESAKAFVTFLRTPPAQKIFGQKGYRPVVKSVLDQFDYPQPSSLFTIDRFGGWSEVTDKFFDRDNGLVAKIEQGLGVSTDSG